MTETLEKEILEEEKNSKTTIFETELFKEVYKSIAEVKGEIRTELKDVLISGLKKFVEENTCNTDSVNWESVEIAFYAGIATVLGGDVFSSIKKENKKKILTDIEKRIIRKENFIGFDIEFIDSNEKGKTILPKEQYDELILSGKTMDEIVKSILPEDKKIKSVCPMTTADLDKWLDISADQILKGEKR